MSFISLYKIVLSTIWMVSGSGDDDGDSDGDRRPQNSPFFLLFTLVCQTKRHGPLPKTEKSGAIKEIVSETDARNSALST